MFDEHTYVNMKTEPLFRGFIVLENYFDRILVMPNNKKKKLILFDKKAFPL